MLKPVLSWRLESRGLAALILFQFACSVFFIFDSVNDFRSGDTDLLHMLPEVLATAGLAIAIIFEVRVLLGLLQKQQDMAQSLSVAAGALADIMENYFQQWQLTPAEHDVAVFAIKGYAIAEIAQLRGSAEGTVKAQLNAIYRKAGVSGQPQLVSLLVEDLLRAPLVPAGKSLGDNSGITQRTVRSAGVS